MTTESQLSKKSSSKSSSAKSKSNSSGGEKSSKKRDKEEKEEKPKKSSKEKATPKTSSSSSKSKSSSKLKEKEAKEDKEKKVKDKEKKVKIATKEKKPKKSSKSKDSKTSKEKTSNSKEAKVTKVKSNKENSEFVKSTRRVSFEFQPTQLDLDSSQSSQSTSSDEVDSDSVDSDLSGEISSGSDKSLDILNEAKESHDDNQNMSNLHKSARALPSVALKAIQAMQALKLVEPVALESDPKDSSSSYLASPASATQHKRTIATPVKLHAIISPVAKSPASATSPSPGAVNWDKLNRRRTYKHFIKPNQLDDQRRVASEQTGKFFQMIQRQQGGEVKTGTAKALTQISRSQDDLSISSREKKPPHRVRSANPELHQSLSAINSRTLRRKKSGEASTSNIKFMDASSKSFNSRRNQVMEDSSKVSHARSEHDEARAARRKQQRDALQKSFSSEHAQPSVRRRRKDGEAGLNPSRLRRHRSAEEEITMDKSAATIGRSVRRTKTMGDNSTMSSRSRIDRSGRQKMPSNIHSRGQASLRPTKEEDILMEDKTAFDVSNLALDDKDDFGFLAQENDKFVSMHDIVKNKGNSKRYSIWED